MGAGFACRIQHGCDVAGHVGDAIDQGQRNDGGTNTRSSSISTRTPRLVIECFEKDS
jgi:hypothetical protein